MDRNTSIRGSQIKNLSIKPEDLKYTGDAPADGQVPSFDLASGDFEWGDAGAGGMTDIVEDLTPQLGGDLDLNGKNIDFPTTPNISDCLDEDNMVSDSATKLATQQSIKKYIDDNTGIDDYTIKRESNELKIADRIEQNILLNAFRIAINGSLTQFNMVDGIVDEFEDESGVDTGASTNEDYDSSNDLYSPVAISPVGLDYMEYATDEEAQTAYVSDEEPASWDLLVEDCSDISDWVDEDTGTAVSEIDPAGQIRMDTNGDVSSVADLNRDIGNFPSQYTAEIKIYHDSIGAISPDYDAFNFTLYSVDFRLHVYFGTDGIFIAKPEFVEVGTNLVDTGVWTTWRFLVDASAGGASATVDVYKNGVLVASDIDCSSTGTYTDGVIRLNQRSSATTNNRVSHIDHIKIVTGLYSSPNLQSYSESTIKEQGSYSLKGIANIADSLNGTLIRTVDPTIDLSGFDSIKLDVRASRTGSQFKIAIHDLGGTTTEHTVNIAVADTWQIDTWDISGVSDANKDAIDSIIITIVNADAENTFYIDNMYAPGVTNNMTLISQSTIAEAQPADARIVIMEEDTDAITENVDLKAYISRDGGTTYSQVTLSDEGDYETSKRILSGVVDISGQPAGTTMKYKIETLNNKDCKIHGLGELWN